MMRCPKCNAENAEGAALCASCGADLTAPAEAPSPAAPRGRSRLSGMAVLALIAACAAPWCQVLRDLAIGPSDPDQVRLLLTALDIAATVLFLLAVALGAIVFVKVLVHRGQLRGAALGLGAFVLGIGGMLSDMLGTMTSGTVSDILTGMGGGSGVYNYQITLVIAAAAIVSEIVLAFTGRGERKAA